MLYPIWQPLPRPPHFPEAPKLDRLLDSYFDPAIGRFSLGMMRRNARDLRKGLFGPKGSRDVPKGEGVRTFRLPNGWTLRLTYDVPPNDWSEPGNVVAEFTPPTDALGGGGKFFSPDRADKHAPKPDAHPDAQPAEFKATRTLALAHADFGQLHFQPLEQAWTP